MISSPISFLSIICDLRENNDNGTQQSIQEPCAFPGIVVADFFKQLQTRKQEAENSSPESMVLHSLVHEKSLWHDIGMQESGKANLYFATGRQKR